MQIHFLLVTKILKLIEDFLLFKINSFTKILNGSNCHMYPTAGEKLFYYSFHETAI